MDNDGYCFLGQYKQVCRCTVCGSIALREGEGSEEFYAPDAEGEMYPAATGEWLCPPRAISEDLIDRYKELPPHVATTYRDAVCMIKSSDWSMAALALYTLFEQIWRKVDERGLTINDCVAVWAKKGWLKPKQADELNTFVQIQLKQSFAWQEPASRWVSPALDGVESLLQRVFLGVQNPVTSFDKIADRAAAEDEKRLRAMLVEAGCPESLIEEHLGRPPIANTSFDLLFESQPAIASMDPEPILEVWPLKVKTGAFGRSVQLPQQLDVQGAQVHILPLKIKVDTNRQYVELPENLMVQGDQVYAWRDPATGEVTLGISEPAKAWTDLFASVEADPAPDDFMSERPLNTQLNPKGVFDGE